MITINNGKYSSVVYDKRDCFNLNIENFPHLSLNIPAYDAQIPAHMYAVVLRDKHGGSFINGFDTQDSAWY